MPPFTRLTIHGVLLEEVLRHAREDSPIECCGLLLGTIANGVGIVTTRFAIANELRSESDYLTEPSGMFLAFRYMRDHGLELLAIYHSHPTSAPVPSRRDIEGNTYGESVIHLIVGLRGENADVRAWWLMESGYREAVVVVAGFG